MAIKPKKLSFAEFKSIYSKVPRLTVEVLIKTPKGIALTKRDIEPCKGMWHTPGGTVLKGEKLEETVKRVAESETGLKVKVVKFLGVAEYDFKKYFSQPIGLIFLTKVIGGKMKTDKQASEIDIFRKIPKNTIKDHALFIRKYLNIK